MYKARKTYIHLHMYNARGGPMYVGVFTFHTEQNRYSICYSLGSFIDPSIIFSRIPAGGPHRANRYFHKEKLPNMILC